MNLSLIQTDLYWENPTANLAMLEEKIFSMEHNTDLIVLPEMFSTGFSMNPQKTAEPMNLTATRWMKQMAAQTGAVITGSLVIREGENFYNRLLWVAPNGEMDTYDKRHLFRMAKEHEIYTAGSHKIVKEIKGWKICPLICYDLRFPVWSRNQNLAYDLLIYVANWPAVRMHQWDSLLVARAIENQAYVVGVNRIGNDGNGITHAGHTQFINFKGEIIEKNIGEARIIHQKLDKESLENFRKNFPAYLDADDFEIK